jgi:serine phosphatase RsbU (regulator of sigma subunit)
MIATSAFMVAFVVALLGFVTNQMVEEDLATDSARVSTTRRQAMRETGLLLTQMVAQGSLPLLAQTQLADLRGLVSRLVDGSDREGIDIRMAAVVDDRGETVGWPFGMEKPELTPDLFGLESFAQIDSPRVIETDVSNLELSNFYVIAPVKSGEVRLGHAIVEFGAGPLIAELDEIHTYTAERIARSARNTLILGALFIILGIFIAIVQSLRITGPVLRLAGAVEKIASGDLETRAEVRSKDEIGILGRSVNNLADRIQGLLKETAEKATMKKELEVARVIQETLLPPNGIIERPPLTIYGYFRSATVCGGDFWSVADIEDGRTLIVVGDVTGHGVPSAMITATAKSAMDTVRSVRGKKLALTYLLEEMNKTIFASAKRKFVMTFFAMTFDPRRNELTFSNAGHNFPYLLRKTDGKVGIRSLVARGNRLGDVEESRFMEHTLEVQSGDLVVLYTDGLTEYRNDKGEEYSEKRFRRMLKRFFADGVDTIGKNVLNDLAKFAAQAPQEDDVTLVVFRVGQLHPATIAPRRSGDMLRRPAQ